MSNLPWNERIPAISINPDMATREDIARLAAELMDARHELYVLKRQQEDPISKDYRTSHLEGNFPGKDLGD